MGFQGFSKAHQTTQIKYVALPVNKPYRRLIRFQGLFKYHYVLPQQYKKTVKKKRELFLGLSQIIPNFAYVTIHYPHSGSGILT